MASQSKTNNGKSTAEDKTQMKRLKLENPPRSDTSDKKVYPPMIDRSSTCGHIVSKGKTSDDDDTSWRRKLNALAILGSALHLYRHDKLPLLKGTSFTLVDRYFRCSRPELAHVQLKHLPAGYQFEISPNIKGRLKVVSSEPLKTRNKRSVYRSIDSFIPHLLWLEDSRKTGKKLDYQKCECRVCTEETKGIKRKAIDGKEKAANTTVKKINLEVKKKAKKQKPLTSIAEKECDDNRMIKEETESMRTTVRIKMKEAVKEEKKGAVIPFLGSEDEVIQLIPATRVLIEPPSMVDYLMQDTIHIPLPTILAPDNSLLDAAISNETL
ncbi:hypothetical protein BDF20DRAFT_831344 [Mycotypha africana]|uniref:uncharacterized protein n=1 Tax=Mycotypha africana TaxID=64632 RepID=UPI00230032BF|nr:uncharacterized protein BDF20DRAFT_831344 [Mycotypha africana]KAI8991289.1 hypothetical protein BDF20DRAFT_831344 [Mycotypha africana]